MPRIAIVGLGIGRAHLRSLLEPPAAATVCALCDVDRKRREEVGAEFGVPALYGDYSRMLQAERPDAVIVATPNDLHHEVALAALEAGCDVMVEKPLAHSLAAARTLAAAVKRRKRRLMIDLSLRFGAAARTVKKYVDSGRCGPLYHGSTYWCRTRGIPTWGRWFTERRRSGGGPVIDLGVHRLDLVLWLLGEPRVESVAAVTHDRLASVLRRPLRLRHKVDVEDFGGGLLRLEGGRSVVFEVSWAENSGRREVMVTRVLGEKGGAVQRNIDHTYRYQAELYADRRGRLVEVESKAFAQKALVPAREFARGVAAGRIDGPDAQTGLRLQLVLEAIYRSAADGREVALKELGP